MKENLKLQKELLVRLEAAPYGLLFEEFFENPHGGFEESRTPEWSDEETYNLRLLVEKGLVRLQKTKGDEPWLFVGAPGDTYAETYAQLTAAGHGYIAKHGFRGWLSRQIKALWNNVLTILVTVLSTLAGAWALNLLGLGN